MSEIVQGDFIGRLNAFQSAPVPGRRSFGILDVGDEFWHMNVITCRKHDKCGFCSGNGRVTVSSDRAEYKVNCPACHGNGWDQDPDHDVEHFQRAVINGPLTVGEIRARLGSLHRGGDPELTVEYVTDLRSGLLAGRALPAAECHLSLRRALEAASDAGCRDAAVNGDGVDLQLSAETGLGAH